MYRDSYSMVIIYFHHLEVMEIVVEGLNTNFFQVKNNQDVVGPSNDVTNIKNCFLPISKYILISYVLPLL